MTKITFLRFILFTVFCLSFFSTKTRAQVFIGVSYGSESVLALPKVAVQYDLEDWGSKKIYMSTEASAWFVFGSLFSFNQAIGFRYKGIALEHSIGYWVYPKQGPETIKNGPFSHVTINPKFCIHINQSQVRFGPAFFIWRSYAPDNNWELLNLSKFGSIHYNIEFMHNMDEF